MRCHHHNEPRVQLYVPKEETFPIPLKYIDVRRSIHTDLDVMQEKRVDDYWNLDPNISVFRLTCCTHTFLVYIHCAYTSHILMRVTHMHGSRLTGVCSAHVVISPSSHRLPFHVSPVLAPAVR